MGGPTVVFVDLSLWGFQWSSLLDRGIPELGRRHLWIEPATDERPHTLTPVQELNTLCGKIRAGEPGCAVVNLGYKGQVERHRAALDHALAPELRLYLHASDRQNLINERGEDLLPRCRPYTTAGLSPEGNGSSELERNYLDLLATMGVRRPPRTLASLVHDFSHDVSRLLLAYRVLERPDWGAALDALRRTSGGGPGALEKFGDSFRRHHSDLAHEIKGRQRMARLTAEEAVALEAWRDRTRELRDRVQALIEGKGGAGLEKELDEWVQSLNSVGRIRL